MTQLEIFRLVASEFSDVKDEDVEKWLELSKPLLSVKRFGNLYDQALALITAHRMKMAGVGDNSMGSIADSMRLASYSEGEVSVNYTSSQQTNVTTDAEYALTVYGLQYLSLRRSKIMTILSAGEA